MAFNLQTLKTRAITSAVFVLVMLLGLLWNQWSFFILFSIIHKDKKETNLHTN